MSGAEAVVPVCEALGANVTGIVARDAFLAAEGAGVVTPPQALEFTGSLALCQVCKHHVDVEPGRPFLAPGNCRNNGAIAAALARTLIPSQRSELQLDDPADKHTS